MSVIIRPGGPDDVPAVGAVHSAARRAGYARILSPEALAAMDPDAMRAYWAERLPREAGTHQLLLAERDGAPVGFCYVGPGGDGRGLLCAIHVVPPAHGTGVARLLMAAALDALRARGHDAFELWVLDGNDRAIAFYGKCGWKPDGTRRTAMLGDTETTQLRYTYA
ncbi:N-acetyltransferase family protein [Longispora urticae]